jgi:hypothetical protein
VSPQGRKQSRTRAIGSLADSSRRLIEVAPAAPGSERRSGQAERSLDSKNAPYRAGGLIPALRTIGRPGARVWLKTLILQVWLWLIGRPAPRDDTATHWDERPQIAS